MSDVATRMGNVFPWAGGLHPWQGLPVLLHQHVPAGAQVIPAVYETSPQLWDYPSRLSPCRLGDQNRKIKKK